MVRPDESALAATDGSPGERYLLPGEVAVVIVPRHWVLVAGPASAGAAAFVAAAALSGWAHGSGVLLGLIWVLALGVMGWSGYRFVSWSIERFIVTDRRLLLVSGLVNRTVAVMPLRKVTDLTYRRSIWGRLLGYGGLVIESAAQDQALRDVGFLPSPDQLYQRVSQLLFPEATSDPTAARTPVRSNKLPGNRSAAPVSRDAVPETPGARGVPGGPGPRGGGRASGAAPSRAGGHVRRVVPRDRNPRLRD